MLQKQKVNFGLECFYQIVYNYLVSERQTNLLNKNLKIRIAKLDLNVFNLFVIMITSVRAKVAH
jgi:hypothetical protein